MSYGTVKPSASKPDHSNLSAPLLQSAAGASPPSPPVSDDETPTAACGQESHDNAFWEALKAFYVKNIGLFFVFVAQVFASIEASASFIAFVGVLVIARPAFLFPSQDDGSLSIHSIDVASSHFNASPQGGLLPPVKATPAERSIAIVCAILGSFAAATAYAIIRTIGKRAHSLVSVNYFAVLATVSSFLIIMIHPDLQFEIPQTPIQW
ncbi:hypothetical protein AUP68_07735 [Ilyonectria robusta]